MCEGPTTGDVAFVGGPSRSAEATSAVAAALAGLGCDRLRPAVAPVGKLDRAHPCSVLAAAAGATPGQYPAASVRVTGRPGDRVDRPGAAAGGGTAVPTSGAQRVNQWLQRSAPDGLALGRLASGRFERCDGDGDGGVGEHLLDQCAGRAAARRSGRGRAGQGWARAALRSTAQVGSADDAGNAIKNSFTRRG